MVNPVDNTLKTPGINKSSGVCVDGQKVIEDNTRKNLVVRSQDIQHVLEDPNC